MLLPPALPPSVLARPHLEARIGPSVATKLTLVTGPAGAGKTTLVRAWLANAQARWAWITVEPAIATPDQFWVLFVRAVQQALPGVVLDVVDAIGQESICGHDVARGLVADLHSLPNVAEPAAPVVVVVDDAHLLDAASWNDLEWVIAHQPLGLHLVLTSRSDPPFPVARLRALGAMTEIRQRDLAMSRDETAALAAVLGDPGPTADLVELLHERTEGWAAGIRLALLALQHGETVDDVLGREVDAAGMTGELLLTEALERQPAELRLFLDQTSVVGVLDPRLCEALTGRHDSRDLLRRLAAEHVFITALDGQPDHYRYHPMFAELLRQELRASDHNAEGTQHLKAARWFEQEQRYPDAIEHANAGGHFDVAFSIIVGRLGDLYAGGHRESVGRWLLAMPDSFVVADPARTVEHCAALLFVVRPEWLRWLRRARAVVGPDRPDLAARLELFGALGHAGQGHIEQFEQHVARAHELRGEGICDPFDEVIDAWRVRLLTLRGRHDDAVELAQSLFRRPRRLLRDLPLTSLLATTLFAAGDPVSGDLAVDVVEQWRALGEPDFMGMADALCVASDLALRRGEPEEAENLAASAVAVTSEQPTHLLGARAEIALGRVEGATGRGDDARRRLRDLRGRLAASGAAGSVLELVDDALRSLTSAPSPTTRAVEGLTEREETILGLLASHRTFPEIGRELFISRHTVKTHVGRIYRKLGVSSRSDAVRAAGDLGLLATQ